MKYQFNYIGKTNQLVVYANVSVFNVFGIIKHLMQGLNKYKEIIIKQKV